MDFATIKDLLSTRGWTPSEDSVASPSGGIWIDRVHLDGADVAALYGAFARREDRASRARDGSFAQECRDAMDALETDDAVKRVRLRHIRFESIVSPWLQTHGMLITTWDFSLPSLRGTGLHPDGGVGAIEVLHRDDDVWMLSAYRWRDDIDARKRHSWTRHWEGRGARTVNSSLGRAWRELLESRPESAFRESELSGGDSQTVESLAGWLSSLPLLDRGAG